MRYMFLVKTEGGGSPSPPAFLDAMHKMAQREVQAGRMLDNAGLAPLAAGAQLQLENGKISVIDGPFVEAKEIVGGYAVFELPGREEAMASAREFLQLHADLYPGWNGVCELREIAGSQ